MESKQQDQTDTQDGVLPEKADAGKLDGSEDDKLEKSEGRHEKSKENDEKEQDQSRNKTEQTTETPVTTDTRASEASDKVNQEMPQATSIEDPDREKREREEKILTYYKNLSLPKRPRSMIKSELLVKDVKKFIEDMKKQTAPEDLDVRVIPSNMACRFELPIDLTRLKGETPLSYLKKYCHVTDSRRTVYGEKFENYSRKRKAVTVSSLQSIYEDLFHESRLKDESMHLQRLLMLDLSMELDVETFTVISCLMERIMLKSKWKGPPQGYKKNVFEGTNFSALNGKLEGIDASPQMMILLQYIRGT